MWIYLTLASAVLLGVYDIFKRISLNSNSVMWTLFILSAISTVLLGPFFRLGPAEDLLLLIPKSVLVTLSWISGLAAMKTLPLTTVSTLKASRPVFVVAFSIILFGERLNLWQWAGVVVVICALFMLGRSSRKEGIYFSRSKGFAWMLLSIVTGAASALYDKQVVSCMHMPPMFVQCWSNLFITALMGLVLAARRMLERKKNAAIEKFQWDWNLLLAAVTIVLADACYFYSLSFDGAMLSIMSLIRRSSVIVTFVLSAWLFKENRVKEKGVAMAILFAGVTALVIFS